MTDERVYYGQTTYSQRKYLFELVEELGNVSEACRRAKVSRGTYYVWKNRYEEFGIEGIRETKSRAPHNPPTIDPLIEKRIVNLKREHPDWGKKKIAQWIWKENNWEPNVAINTVKNVLSKHGLWKGDEKKRKKKNKGITADKPNTTINVDLCFIPEEKVHEIDFSSFFDLIDEKSEKNPSIEEKKNNIKLKTGLEIFSEEEKNYNEKMDDYVIMRKNKQDKKNDNKKKDITEIEIKADRKQSEEELRTWRRRIRIERKKKDEKWKKYRKERIKYKKEIKEKTKDEIKEFQDEINKKDAEWKRKKAERKELVIKKKKEDEEWRDKRKKSKEELNVAVTSLVAVLVIIDNCTRKCIGLPLFIKGKHVSAVDVVKSLEKSLNQELNYIISDNGKQFVAKAFQKFCENNSFVHVRISPHRPATNGIAERFVRRLKEMLAERTWVSAEELSMILEEILEEYNDSPHQGINGLSPKEYERRLMCTV
jgi:hypothetical protein